MSEAIEENLYLVHSNFALSQLQTSSPFDVVSTVPGSTQLGGTGSVPSPNQTSKMEVSEEGPIIQSLEISGNVSFLNYTHIFSSFIQHLKDNRIEIDIRIKGHSTANDPITKTSQKFKIIQESAKQLGLNFKIEE